MSKMTLMGKMTLAGPPKVEFGSCPLKVVRLGDLPEPENIFSVEQGATDPD